MVHRAFLILLICLFSDTLKADIFAVYFFDKGNSPFSVSNPTSFLSEICLARRAKKGVGVYTTDIPVNTQYIQALNSFQIELKYCSKWLNCAVIKCENPMTMDSIRKLPFVTKVILLKSNSPYTFKRDSKFEELENTQLENESLDKKYGRAKLQNEMIRADFLHRMGYKADGIHIAVFDVGFANANNIQGFKPLFDENRILETLDVVDSESNVYDNKSHGTSCLSCMAAYEEGSFVGTAPRALYSLYRTEDDKSETLLEEYNWVYAAEIAENAGAQVFSTSLGYTDFDDPNTSHTYADLDGNTTVITKGSNLAARLGVIVVTSAGNEGSKPWYYISAPADADSVLAIGAVRGDRSVAKFSSRGPNSAGRTKPDVCAMGEGPVVYDASGSILQSNGTSFSCPILAGGAACLRQAFPTKSNLEIMDAIRASAHLFKSPNDSFGYGIPDLAVAYSILLNNELPFTTSRSTNLDVFPNPFTSLLQIYLVEPYEGTIIFDLFDLKGKQIQTLSVDLSFNDRKFIEMNTSNLSQGTYLLKIHGKDYYDLKRVVKN